MIVKSEITEKYLELYKNNINKISGISSPFFNSFRATAFEKFNELGIPTKKNEAYKYTNLNIFLITIMRTILCLFRLILLKPKNSDVR